MTATDSIQASATIYAEPRQYLRMTDEVNMFSNASIEHCMVTFLFVRRMLLICWASPYSVMGLAVGAVGLMTGGKVRFREGAIEFYGGATSWFVRHLPLGESTLAITFGHVILGQSDECLDICCRHERVHVRQFERLGPFMGPAYLLSSAWMWAIGRDAYRDNHFEREAYDEGP